MCIGHHITLSLSPHVTTMSETFSFKMVDTIAAFFNVNVTKIKLHRIKVCKKKNLIMQVYLSTGEHRDAKVTQGKTMDFSIWFPVSICRVVLQSVAM